MFDSAVVYEGETAFLELIDTLDKGETDLLAGFEGPSCEDVGLLKLDVLGIRMLDKIMEVPLILKQK